MSIMRSRILLGLATLGLFGSAFAQPAPRSYSSYFFFGDSLTDNGNTFALTGSPPPPYFNGRVSNGITYAEYLRSGLAVFTTSASTVRTNINFAYAGATAAAGSAVPNLAQQVGLYQSRGITAGSNDLFVLLAGANDILNTISNPATQNGTSVTNSAVGASIAVAGAVNSLSGLGAKNILVLNLPDLSKTARFVTGSGAPAATLAQGGSVAFNNDLPGRIAGLNLAADVKVTVFNLGAIFQGILANPARFGFTNTTQEYLGILLAGGNPGDVNGYVFYDGIHPTTKTHAIFAQVLTEVLNPEYVLGASAVQSTAMLIASDMSADAVTDRLNLLRRGAGGGQAHGFASVGYKDGGRDRAGYQNPFDYSSQVVTVGFDLKVMDGVVGGLALSVENLEGTLAGGAGSLDLGGQTITAYAQWRSGVLFGDLTASYGSHDLSKLVRTTAFGGYQTTGRTDGERSGGSLRVGGDFAFARGNFTPFVGLRFIKGRTDGYTETGVSGLDFAFADHTARSVHSQIGATVDWQVSNGAMPLAVSFSAVFQKDLADETREHSGRLANTVSATSRIAVLDGLEESLKLGARVVGTINQRWGWSAGYLAEMRDDGSTANQFTVGLHTGF
ncbi:MAG: autotransporter domain-containing protein [Candidatus Didemnitutus sp.]|nr:autotransporter domain-containing protein [Candidatus Didemnitutus sp.]